MKKCTLVLLTLFTIVACKKGEINSPKIETNVEKATSLADSLTLEGYDTIQDIEEKAAWLREKGDRVKRKLIQEAVLKDHKLKDKIINQKVKYIITWGELKRKIGSHGYDKYLSVEHSGEKIDSLKMVDRFIPKKGESQYRFSTTLIRTLAKVDGKNDDKAEFQFSFALINKETKKSEQTVVVIQVNGNLYYDYSTDPKKIDEVRTLSIPL